MIALIAEVVAAAWVAAWEVWVVVWAAGVQDSQEVYAQITVVGEADSVVEWEEWEADSVVDSTAFVAVVVVASAVEWVEAVCKADSVVLWVVTAADSVAWEAVWVEVWEAMAADSVVWAEGLVVDEADTEAADSEDLEVVEVDEVDSEAVEVAMVAAAIGMHQSGEAALGGHRYLTDREVVVSEVVVSEVVVEVLTDRQAAVLDGLREVLVGIHR